MKKITICTVCMNRLHHLSQTLPVNIAENKDYPNLEYVVLNYNSRDEMDSWIKENMKVHLESGLLKYYKTEDPEYFSLSHSKNMATKLATGEIICNMDADNYAGPEYIKWVENCFATHGSDLVITTLRKDAIPYRDQGGKLCFTKDLFNSVNGYDESIFGYGMDDVDLANRLEKAGGRRFFIEDEKYLKYIGHDDYERVLNYRYPNNLEAVYFCISETSSGGQKILYLFNDGSAASMQYVFNKSMQDNLVVTFVGWTVAKDGQRKASFRQSDGKLTLAFTDGHVITYNEVDQILKPMDAHSGSPWWRKMSKDDGLYFQAVMAYNECLNRLTFVENDRSAAIVNENGWGRGTVYLNFNSRQSFSIS